MNCQGFTICCISWRLFSHCYCDVMLNFKHWPLVNMQIMDKTGLILLAGPAQCQANFKNIVINLKPFPHKLVFPREPWCAVEVILSSCCVFFSDLFYIISFHCVCWALKNSTRLFLQCNVRIVTEVPLCLFGSSSVLFLIDKSVCCFAGLLVVTW